MTVVRRTILWAAVLMMASVSALDAQIVAPRFGKNKVHYKAFKWTIRKTPHFEIYGCEGQERLSERAEKMAERAYRYLSATFQHEFARKIPLIIYASSDDFQQTEVIPGFLDEGIGGVTESLKGRIVIPFLGSYRSFNHVIVHELTHAFQFDILSGGRRGFSAFVSNVSIPLWFVEGMAEYLSEDANPLTTMWLRDALEQDALPKPEKVDRLQDIRVYRFGQSLWQYLAKTHGAAMIPKLLAGLAEEQSWDDVIEQAAGTTWENIYDGWRSEVKTAYAADALAGQRRIEEQARRVLGHDEKKFALNIIPAISPDGKRIAFVSDREFYRTIYLADAASGKILRKLVEGERAGTFETLRYLNTSIAWSPDSRQIAFNAKAGGENAIYVLDVDSRKIRQKLTPNVSSVSCLAWSPTKREIAFTAVKDGQEDLFLMPLDAGRVTQLTHDLYSNRHPAWSPDGAALAFSTDMGRFSTPEALRFGPSNLAIYDLRHGETTLLADTPANEFSPVWSPDGRMLAYVSDENGTCNLFLLPLAHSPMPPRRYRAGTPRRVTNVTTGIVGVTEDHPALTWAAGTGTLIFSGFTKRGWDLFALEQPDQAYRAYAAEVGFDDAAETPTDAAQRAIAKKDWAFPLAADAPTAPVAYRSKLRPEYLLFGGGASSKDLFLMGYLGFGDMLSDRRLAVALNMTEVFDESDFMVSYLNRSRRLNYAVRGVQFTDDGGSFSMDGKEFEVNVERGLGADFSYPFDKFTRVEWGLEGWMVEGERGEGDEREPSEDFFYAVPFAAYVHDTSLYTYLGPLDGMRARFSLRPALGELTFLTLTADYRRYIHVTRKSALALRGMTLANFGENARMLEMGGALTFRGRGFEKDADDEDALVKGETVALANVEYRFPLLPIDLLRGVVFCDAAVGSDDHEMRTAFGGGARIPVSAPFGVINVRVDAAMETDFERVGPANVFFSIANDF